MRMGKQGRLLIISMAAMLFVSLSVFSSIDVMEEADADSYICGDGLTYKISGTTLTISKTGEGTGVMTDYDNGSNKAPWSSETGLKTLRISEGVSSVGTYAFYGCSNFTGHLIIPSTVGTIGQSAFAGCSGFNGSLIIPSGISSIQENAFTGCTSVKFLGIGSGLSDVHSGAFSDWGFFSDSGLTDPISVSDLSGYAYKGSSVSAMVMSETGTCGTDLHYTISDDKTTLFIYGTGAMTNYDTGSNKAPWSSDKGTLKILSISKGVTTIGNNAFRGFTGLSGTLVLPSGLKTIGSSSFYGCTGFTGDLILPSGLTSVGGEAFKDCTGFTGSLVLPSSLVETGYQSFTKTSIKEIIIPSNVRIGTESFNYCSNVTYIAIGSGATVGTFGYGFSFYDYDDKSSGCVTGRVYQGTIGHMKMVHTDNCGDSAYYSISGNGKNLFIYGSGSMYDYDNDSNKAPWDAYKETLKTLVISRGVTSVGSYAFNGCSGLTGALTIPDTVKTIGSYAFCGCTGFDYDLSISAVAEVIGDHGFQGCSNLIAHNPIPSNVQTLGDYAFDGCSGFNGSLVIPNKVVSMGAYAFRGCSGIVFVSIGSGASGMDQNAFYGWTFTDGTSPITDVSNLPGHAYKGTMTEMVLTEGQQSGNIYYVISDDGTTLFIYGESTMSNYSETGDGRAPWIKTNQSTIRFLTISDGVKSIGNYAFNNCSKISGSLDLSSDVTLVGYRAFNGCTGFKGVMILSNSLKTIDGEAFKGCSGFTGSLTLPPSLTYVGGSAFYDCSGLNGTVVINSGVSFGLYAMHMCSFKEIIIQSNVTIGGEMFRSCTSMKYVSIGSGSYGGIFGSGWKFYDFDDKPLSGYIAGYSYSGTTSHMKMVKTGDCGENLHYSISDSGTSLHIFGSGDMYDYDNDSNKAPWAEYRDTLKALTISKSTASIGSYAFYGCSGLIGPLTIPDTVKTIGSYAFYGCSGFDYTLYISANAESIGSYAFYGCSGFTGHIAITSFVTEIGDNAFNGCSGFNGSLILPNSIESIGAYAFKDCSSIVFTSIGAGASGINRNAFNGWTFMNGTTTISSVSNLPGHAYKGTTTGMVLTEGEQSGNIRYVISDDGTTLFIYGEGTMSNYSDTGDGRAPWIKTNQSTIRFLTISDGVKSIGNFAFKGCSKLSGSLVIPSSVGSVGGNAFQACTGFTGTLCLSSGVKNVGQYAFYNCSGFTEMAIPSSVKSIGYQTFYGCSGVTFVSIGKSTTGIDGGAFYNWSFYGLGGSPKITSSSDLPGYSYAGSISNMVRQPQHEVTYDVLSGSEPAPIQEAVAENRTFKVAPYSGKMYGCRFLGWSDGTDMYQPGDKIKMATEDYSFTAVFDLWSDISFDVNGGTGSVGSVTLYFGTQYSLPTYSGTKSGYTFVGWSDGFNTYMPGYKITSGASDQKFTAFWVKNPLIVSYDVNGGSDNVPEQAVKENGTFVLASYSGTKPGYTFVGWSDGLAVYLPGSSYTIGTSSIKFVAVWEGSTTHVASYDVNGGSMSVPDQIVKEDTSFVIPDYTGARAGFCFAGWNDGNKTYQPGESYEMGTSDIRFTAVWNDSPEHAVTYDVNGGTGQISEQKVKEGLSFRLADYDGENQGLSFIGWNDGAGIFSPGSSYLMGASDVSFKAEWIDNTMHVVSYELDGGSGSIPNQTLAEGASFTIMSYAGTKVGCSFDGWNDGSDVYQPGSQYTMGSSNVVFTAVWCNTPSHTVSYDVCGGSDSVSAQDVTEGSVFVLASYSGTKNGCVFVGWNDGSDTYRSCSSYLMGGSDLCFSAVWAVSGDQSTVEEQPVIEANPSDSAYYVVGVAAAVIVLAFAAVIVMRK